jgi:anti-anti-sigma factor
MSAAFTARKSALALPHKPARFTSCLVGSALVLVTADGEIDACNARNLASYIEEILDTKRRLVVDLRGLTFFGTPGFSALHCINVTCSRRDVSWVLVPGPEVSRLLRICDPERGLPFAETLERAIAVVSRPPRTHLKPLPHT